MLESLNVLHCCPLQMKLAYGIEEVTLESFSDASYCEAHRCRLSYKNPF